jgi:glycosyltransferase involved in cell wall biosynthesis
MQEDVASYVNAADLIVLTSDTEGIPGVILEAGLLQVPSVAFDVGGIHDCVIDGKTGILVPPNNHEQLAFAVMQLLQNSEMRREMGKKAKQWVLDRFAMSKIVQQYLEFYDTLAANKVKMNEIITKPVPGKEQ